MEEELRYYAEAAKLPYDGVHVLNLLNELTTLMVPIVNFTSYTDIIGEKWSKKLGVDHIDLSLRD